jgi:hypothetical protein
VSQKVTLKMSAAAAAYVRADVAKEDKMRAARREVTLPPGDVGVLLFFLSRDPDPDVKGAAMQSLRDLPEELLLSVVMSPGTHPLVLDALARIHGDNVGLAEAILTHPDVNDQTVEFLAGKGYGDSDEDLSGGDVGSSEEGEKTADDEESSAPEESREEETEEHLSKYKLMQHMSIGEKIKMALTGDKEWRCLLIKDTNKLVSTAVMKNPRITDPEVLAIAKSIELNEEIFRLLCNNKEWIKIYPIRKALVENIKTPLPKALRFLATLNVKDILALSKSKNISSTIARQAQRIAMSKRK